MRLLAPIKDRLEEKIERIPFCDCWFWTGSQRSSGYGAIRSTKERGFRMDSAHRVAYEVFVGPIPAELSVLHKCDVRVCVNPAHLYLGTDFDNAQDRKNRGRNNTPRGEKQGSAKLTWEQVERLRADQRPYSVLSNEYGVCISNISRIKNNKGWVRQ